MKNDERAGTAATVEPDRWLTIHSWQVRLFILIVLVGLTGCESPDSARSIPDSGVGSTFSMIDVSAEAGLADFNHFSGTSGNKWFPETMSGGGGFVDLDGDGDDDIVLVSGGPIQYPFPQSSGDLVTYLNNGTGQFTETRIPGLQNLPGYGMGIAAGDLDNDGDQDLIYSTLGPNTILRNDGDRFTSIESELLAERATDWSTSILVLDADRDGWLDILIGNYVDWTPESDIYCTTDGTTKGFCTPELYQGQTATFYRNLGNGRFEDASRSSGLDAISGKTLGLAAMDHNADGWPDIVVANDTDPDQLMLGSEGGVFVDVGVASGMAFDERGRARAGMGIDTGITDRSGATSVFVGNFSDEMVGVYRQLSDRAFLDRAALSGIGQASIFTLAFGLKLADFDLDGHLDVAVANGHVEESIEAVRDNVDYAQPIHLFMGDGEGRFEDQATSAGVTTPYVGRALAVSDIDGDGDTDLLLVENNRGAHLWSNDSSNPGLRVVLTGQASNRDAIGTRVTLWSGGEAQHRYVTTGGSYLSASSAAIGFAEPANGLDSLVVTWPSGARSILTDNPGTPTWVIQEPGSGS